MTRSDLICALAATLFVSGALAQQMQVQRCEGKNGTVTSATYTHPTLTTPPY